MHDTIQIYFWLKVFKISLYKSNYLSDLQRLDMNHSIFDTKIYLLSDVAGGSAAKSGDTSSGFEAKTGLIYWWTTYLMELGVKLATAAIHPVDLKHCNRIGILVNNLTGSDLMDLWV